MQNQFARADEFRRLHIRGNPVVIYNAWDAGSARAVAAAGAHAIGTGSWSVAAAHGFPDGETMSLELAIANLERIVHAVDLPVSMDLEAGYGEHPEDVAHSVTLAVRAGAVGINLEDGLAGKHGIRDAAEQVARITAARAAAAQLSVPLFINARTDFFLQADSTGHDASHVAAVKERAAAYEAAGASGLFVPGVVQAEQIREICAGTPLPVNVMVLPALPKRSELAGLGVARISHGPRPYRVAMKFLEECARAAFEGP
jgi:methylisocitrate lyase